MKLDSERRQGDRRMGMNGDFHLHIFNRDTYNLAVSGIPDHVLDPTYTLTLTDGADDIFAQLYDMDDSPPQNPMPEGLQLTHQCIEETEDGNGPLVYFVAGDLPNIVSTEAMRGSIDETGVMLLNNLPDDAIIVPFSDF